MNFNGASEPSDPASFIICKVPGFFYPPVMSAVTRTTMTLSWKAPQVDAGCPILSFHLFMYNGAGGSFTEIDALQINYLPALRSHTLTFFTAADTSKTFRFYMVGDNAIGSTESKAVGFVLAGVPDKPTTVPTLNFS